MILHDYELSGNCYKIRLFLSILGLEYQKRPVDFHPGLEHKSQAFLELNPLGQLPVLEDDGQVLRDAQAILIYLAVRYDKSRTWYPIDEPHRLGKTAQWLAFADGLTATSSAARLQATFFYDLDGDAARAGAHRLLRVLDEHLWFLEQDAKDWIVDGVHPTIADIACFPYVMLSEEGGISRQDYPAVRRWCDRVKRIPGFTGMSGIFTTSHAG